VPEYWEGFIALPGGRTLEFYAHFTPGSERPHAGTIDIPAQGARALPLHDVELGAERLSFRLDEKIGASWDCRWQESEATCTFRQHGLEVEAEMEAIGAEEFAEATKLRRPQTPEPPFPYAAEEVEFDNADQGVHLAGTLTIPEGDGPFPAVLLISGSGAQDRDETLFEHKPFWVLADHLSRRGVAVLRVDDRGVGKSTGNVADATSEDFATDVLAGIAFLKQRPELDAEKLGLIGHSEGGLIAPLAANRSKDVAFVVLLAAPGVPGREIIDHQARLIAEKSGAGPDLIARDEEQRHRMYAILAEHPDDDDARRELVAYYRAQLDALPERERESLGDLDKVARAQVGEVASPWFRFFLEFDPGEELRKLKIPVLALWGEKDLQVDPEQNLPALRKALKKARNRKATLEVMPGLNHLFQTAQRGTPDEYVRIEETLDPAVLGRIAEWIADQTH
jgi:hypothetical protein